MGWLIELKIDEKSPNGLATNPIAIGST